MKHAALVVVTALVTALVAAAAGLRSPMREARGGPAMKTTYLVLYRPGPHWVAGKPVRQQPPKEHGKYMLDLYARGAMKLAGPFEDSTGAAIMIEAADEAEAKAIVAGDPAVKDGIFTPEIHPWALVSWETYLKKK